MLFSNLWIFKVTLEKCHLVVHCADYWMICWNLQKYHYLIEKKLYPCPHISKSNQVFYERFETYEWAIQLVNQIKCVTTLPGVMKAMWNWCADFKVLWLAHIPLGSL
jgi:hypothetical protein